MDDGAGQRNAPVYCRLREMGISDRLARQRLSEHGEGTVNAKIDYVAGQGGVRSPERYLAALLCDDTKPREAGPASDPAKKLGRLQEIVKSRTPTQRDTDKPPRGHR